MTQREGWTALTYLYEQLDPERFQHFCQALIVGEYPGTQCFPVGQRDGGRDAVQYFIGPRASYRLFQVKFVRKPETVEDAHKWLVGVMEDELPKIREILDKNPNAEEYIIMSNIAGTAYPGSGSIDTLNEALNTDVNVPIRVWWRDDLDRRCDGRSDVKWSFPEILRGVDLLQALAQSIGPDLQGHRLDVLRAFAVYQFDMDNEVRFKQVELSNEILNLFVDVPARVSAPREEGRRREEKQSTEIRYLARQLAGAEPWDNSSDAEVGAATLFLNDQIAQRAGIVVLEGGPGQGKSTLAQYVCQVHRMKILSRPQFASLPAHHQPLSARFPIKVDLREYATWLSGKNPFLHDADEQRPAHLGKSLESFISALVSAHSGDLTFGPDDLSMVARSSALLIVLDGLDEVAEVKLRNDVVREITAASKRLKEAAASLQVIITTRPSALAEVSDFPTKTFHKWVLSRLGRPLIEEYSERWAKSRHLLPKEAAELRRVLTEKLNQPHMRDLARNPMQLAILLSVIHTRGSSLPDKRTALYDIYVELFLAREADKSEVVKKRQEILIDVHRYLAWVLHSEAETGRTLGKIEAPRLRELIKDYLVSEGREPELADELFTGLAQRVVFIVGAVEGLFEFEVQPLREYFAGRFLYETAPYSPVGNPRSGTKDERFDAVARNTHWLNVTRFYAGCFSKGELPSLVDRLEVLCTDPDLALTSHPRSLAATLVADWVFSQNARSLKRVVELILSRDGYRSLLGDDRYSASGGEPLALPEGCGRVELLSRCMDVLRDAPPRDIQMSVSQLAQRNGSRDEIRDLWLAGFPTLNSPRMKRSWIWSGYLLGILQSVPRGYLRQVLERESVDLDGEILSVLLMAGHVNYFMASDRLRGFLIDALLEGHSMRMPRLLDSSLAIFCLAVNPRSYITPHFDHGSIKECVIRQRGIRWPSRPLVPIGDPVADEAVTQFLEIAEMSRREASQVGGDFERFIEKLRNTYGSAWSLWMLALTCLYSGPRIKRTEISSVSLFDESVDLVTRLRYARTQAGAVSWWRQQLAGATGSEVQVWALLALFLCGPATLPKLCGEIDNIIEPLSDSDAQRFLDVVEMFRGLGVRPRSVRVDSLPQVMSPRLAAILSLSAAGSDFQLFMGKHLENYMGSDRVVHEVIYNYVTQGVSRGVIDWSNAVELIRRAYRSEIDSFFSAPYFRMQNDLPLEIARKVASSAVSYPYFLVRAAEASLKREFAKHTVPLSQVAAENGWFDEE